MLRHAFWDRLVTGPVAPACAKPGVAVFGVAPRPPACAKQGVAMSGAAPRTTTPTALPGCVAGGCLLLLVEVVVGIGRMR